MLLIFSVTSYPTDIAHFNSPYRELSNFVQLMELYWSKLVDPSRSPCLKIVNWKRFERRNFLVLRPVLLKIHISTKLIQSYPREYGWWSCGKEKLSIPLEAHHKAQSSDIFLSFQAKKLKAVIFYLLANYAETAYLSFRDRKLLNDVWLVQVRPRKVAVHTFWRLAQAKLIRPP